MTKWYDVVYEDERNLLVSSKGGLHIPEIINSSKNIYIDLLLCNGTSDRFYNQKDGNFIAVGRLPEGMMEELKYYYTDNDSVKNSVILSKSEKFLFYRRGYMFL